MHWHALTPERWIPIYGGRSENIAYLTRCSGPNPKEMYFTIMSTMNTISHRRACLPPDKGSPFHNTLHSRVDAVHRNAHSRPNDGSESRLEFHITACLEHFPDQVRDDAYPHIIDNLPPQRWDPGGTPGGTPLTRLLRNGHFEMPYGFLMCPGWGGYVP